MDRKKIKFLKVITILCVFVLFFELGYISFNMFFKEKKSIYFDGVNSLLTIDNGYVTVGSNNNNDKFYEKAKITKYNKKEEKVSEVIYNSGYNSTFVNVNKDNNSYIAVGSYENSYKQHKNKTRSALLVKYSEDGTKIFDKSFSTLDNSKFNNIITLDDTYLVCGQSVYSKKDFGTSTKGGAILNKYDIDGNLLWSKNYGDNKSSTFNDIIIYDGYIYACGLESSNIGMICKYDMDGNYIDSFRYKFTDNLGFTSITVVSDCLYVCGSKKNNKSIDGLIVKVDMDLDMVSDYLYESDSNERYNKIITDNNNNLVVIGSEILTTKNGINYNGTISKFDLNLVNIDSISYGDDRNDFFTDVKFVDGKLIVVGYSSYEDGSYMSKFINYSSALKVLEVI